MIVRVTRSHGMETELNEELVAFAEEVRRACIGIAGASGAGQTERAGQLALALCTRAASVQQGQLMNVETAAPDRYDLTALTVDLQSEAPELEDGDGGD
jgi:hypothetical protein